MSYERGAFLKELPKKVAELVGYHILLGIAALGGDGLPKAEVQRLLSRAETDARRLIDECEALWLRLKGGIKQAYDATKRRDGEMLNMLTN